MKLVSLKLDPKKAKEQNSCCCNDDRKYAYGTSLSIQDEKIKELGLETVTKNQKVRIVAVGEVVSVSEYDGQENTSSTVAIQIEEIAVEMDNETDRKNKYATMFKD